MSIRQTRVCSIVFAGTLIVAGSAVAQPAGGGETPKKIQADDDSRRLQKLSGMDFKLDMLEGLKGLDGLKGLEGLERLSGLEGLKALDALPGFAFQFEKFKAFDVLAAHKDILAAHRDVFAGHKDFLADSGLSFQKDRDTDRQADAEQRERERETRLYDQAREFFDQGKYDRAIERYSDVISMKGPRADASLYWKAWAQNRAGQRPEALTTISTLSRDFPKSRYLKQAKQLEAEIRRDGGQPVRPDGESDDDLKILAINALLNADSEQAIPMLEKLLDGTASPKLKSRALFVLAQSSSPRAREVLKNIARGNSTPELQSRAIDYLGQHGGRESRAALAEIYSSASDVDVKRRILRAFMVAGEKDRLLSAAQTEQNADLRGEAVQQLGVMGAHDELWQLYQKESAVDVKKRIIRAMFTGGNVTRMTELAKSEQNPELRRTAVANLGVMDSKRTSEALLEIYNTEKELPIKKTVIQGLFQQSNATALVALARKEQDPALKRDIVQKLSVMDNNPIATAYMVEILNLK
jgi:HEAT repeat protein